MPRRQFYAIVMVGFVSLLLGLSFAFWLLTPWGPQLVFGAAASSLAYGILVERRWVQLTHRVVSLPHLAPSLDGFRIAHLSDIHWDARTDPARMCATLDAVSALDADLVVLTGDLVTHSRTYIEPCTEALSRLRGRCGVYAVLGNHDHWANGEMMKEALERRGIRVMSNEHERIGEFWLVGVDDPHLQFADLDAALEGIPDDGRPRVLLAHSPDIMREAQDRVDVVLAGHTHGGQVRFPLVGPVLHATRGKPYVMGMKRAGSTVCFTNRGLGTVLIPIRFNCRPEVAVLTLRGAGGCPPAPPVGRSAP